MPWPAMRLATVGATMDDYRPDEEISEDEGSPPLPHTPPLGIRAVRPGEEPSVPLIQSPLHLSKPERPVGNWLAALVSAVGTVFSIIGTFLTWRVETRDGVKVELIGWDQAGLAVLILLVGLVAAGTTGALWAGQRGVVLKAGLLATGAVLFVATGLEISDIRSTEPSEGFDASVGLGLPVILVGGGLLMVAALLDRGPWQVRVMD